MAQQVRSERLVSRVEPKIFTAIQITTHALQVSMSDYLRNLAIKDLKERGLLTDSMLAELVS